VVPTKGLVMARAKKKKWYSKQLVMPFVKSKTGRWHKQKGKTKRKGNPLFAMRVDRALLAAFVKRHGGDANAQAAVRRYMQRDARHRAVGGGK
jgi:hypothetical protein